jgi:hypothetical protein
MSLQTITGRKDQVSTKTNKFSSMRTISNNLATTDIQGKCKEASRKPAAITVHAGSLSRADAEKCITVYRRRPQAAWLAASEQA